MCAHKKNPTHPQQNPCNCTTPTYVRTFAFVYICITLPLLNSVVVVKVCAIVVVAAALLMAKVRLSCSVPSF